MTYETPKQCLAEVNLYPVFEKFVSAVEKFATNTWGLSNLLVSIETKSKISNKQTKRISKLNAELLNWANEANHTFNDLKIKMYQNEGNAWLPSDDDVKDDISMLMHSFGMAYSNVNKIRRINKLKKISTNTSYDVVIAKEPGLYEDISSAVYELVHILDKHPINATEEYAALVKECEQQIKNDLRKSFMACCRTFRNFSTELCILSIKVESADRKYIIASVTLNQNDNFINEIFDAIEDIKITAKTMEAWTNKYKSNEIFAKNYGISLFDVLDSEDINKETEMSSNRAKNIEIAFQSIIFRNSSIITPQDITKAISIIPSVVADFIKSAEEFITLAFNNIKTKQTYQDLLSIFDNLKEHIYPDKLIERLDIEFNKIFELFYDITDIVCPPYEMISGKAPILEAFSGENIRVILEELEKKLLSARYILLILDREKRKGMIANLRRMQRLADDIGDSIKPINRFTHELSNEQKFQAAYFKLMEVINMLKEVVEGFSGLEGLIFPVVENKLG